MESVEDALSVPYDVGAVEAAVRQLLTAMGEDPGREGLRETPGRVARSYSEIFAGLRTDPSEHLRTTFEVETDDVVVVKDIGFFSMCEHHLLPFFGTVAVAYLPRGGRVAGLSKLARCVEGYSRRPQIQERLTRQIADALEGALTPHGVGVLIKAEHMCMSMRGVRAAGATTVTARFTGDLDEPTRKRDILTLFER